MGTSDYIENRPPRSPVDNNNIIYYNNAIIRNSVTVCPDDFDDSRENFRHLDENYFSVF